jgi:hypothetical protein
MENRELKRLIQERAEDIGINGIMKLVDRCDISYERVFKVWNGSHEAKLKDVKHVLNVLGLKIKYVIEGEE